jgi:Fe-S cluster assembly protein SufD
MGALTSSVVEGLFHDDPEWMRARRRDAFELYESLPMPSRQDEEWRRTDLKGFELPEPAQARRPMTELDGSVPEGVVFMPLATAVREQPDLVESHLHSQLPAGRDKFAALHAALLGGGVLLHVPDGITVAEPLRARHRATSSLALPHTLVIAGRGAGVTLIDEYASEAGRVFASGSCEVFAADGARVGYVSLQRWGRDTWQFSDQRVRAGRDAAVRLVNTGLGARFSKHRVEASLVGQGASAELKAVFFGSGEQLFDYHTLQDHQAPNTTSDLLFKGALRDRARSLYAGMIRIEPGARGSDAYQANRNLLLSDSAKADSIPMLEILNNDVRCTHGATVGPVDPEHLFYLESRGIPRRVAQRMVVQGFFQEVLDRLPDRRARDLVEEELERRSA